MRHQESRHGPKSWTQRLRSPKPDWHGRVVQPWDSALARQARAKKNLGLVEVQWTAAQQKMEEAKTEMAAADKSVNEARQLAVQDTSIFADAEVLVQALPLQQQGLDANAREALARMVEALTDMKATQQEQQQAAPMTPTITQGSEP